MLPTAGGAIDPEVATAFVEEFEGWGVRADVVSARLPAADGEVEAQAQVAALEALGVALGDRPVVRRGALSSALVASFAGSALRVCEDGGMALAASLRGLPAELRAPGAGAARRGEITLSGDLSDRLEAFAYAEVASLIERLRGGGSAAEVAATLSAGGP